MARYTRREKNSAVPRAPAHASFASPCRARPLDVHGSSHIKSGKPHFHKINDYCVIRSLMHMEHTAWAASRKRQETDHRETAERRTHVQDKPFGDITAVYVQLGAPEAT